MSNYSKEKEIWKDLEGYEGYYQASSWGNIRSVDRVVISTDGKRRSLKGKILKPQINKGYYLINLNKNGKKKKALVSRLVAKTFVDNPMQKEEVNHIDEDKLNNSVDNLEWVTSKENANWGTRNKRISQYVKENPVTFSNGQLGKSIYKLDSVTEEVICKYDSVKEALEILGSNPKTGSLSSCLTGNGINKTYKGYKWKYA